MAISCSEKNSFLFVKAKQHNVQIRYFGPDTLTLEDVFVQAFNGGENYGN